MKKIINLSAILFLLTFSFFSCDVGLGIKLNLDPPVVEIITPVFMENIGTQLEITGTASDLQEIVHLFVTIERVSRSGEPWKQEWHGERGAWRSNYLDDDEWVSRSGVWNIEQGPGFVNWSITISMEGAADGEYNISAGAENNVSNRGALAQRRVIIDKDGPVTRILLPPLQFHSVPGEIYNYYEDVYSTFINYQLEDPSIMEKLFNQDITVQYEVHDDFSIDTIAFQLADNYGNYYYNEERIPIQEAHWSGRIIIPEDEINLNALPGKTSPYFLQLISIAADKAGNEEIAAHGWFVYWPESDKPWTAGIGHHSDPQQSQIYPKSDLQLLSYDDDGVYSVTYKIFKADSSLQPVGEPVAQATRINTPLVQGTTPSGFFSFSIQAPEECADYVIQIDCVDINGLSGDRKNRYFFVMDITMPEIEIENPEGTETLFGDINGTFRINGRASDGINPVKLDIVWIKPGNNMDQFEYQSADSNVWNRIDNTAQTGTGSDSAPYWQDTTGNKMWRLNLTNMVTENNRVYRDFDKYINLFSDLGISKNVPLITQTFIFRVEGQTGRSITRLLTLRGDITPPDELSVKTITIRRAGAADNVIQDSDFNNPNYQMPNLEVDDEILMSGTWDDDSLRAWNNAAWNSAGRMGNFTVTWNGFDVTGVVLNQNGTWNAGPYALDIDEVMKGGGRIEARLTDLGGNMTQASVSARADTNVPVLMFISSETPDDSYKAGAVIDIYLEFNKKVRYTGTGASLVLNIPGATPRRALYSKPAGNDPDGDHRHHFSYTVQAGDTISELSVGSIDSPKEHWEDASDNNPNIAIPTGRNLANTKKIRLDTTAPSILSVQAMSNSGYYNGGKTIYILLRFNEPINFIPGSPNNTTLNLNTGGTGAGKTPTLMGQDALLFTYLVETGDNSSSLTANSFSLGGGVITDIAGNILTAVTVPSDNNITNNSVEANRRNIVIDTLKPNAPLLNAAAGTFHEPQIFTITGENADAVLEYSINEGPWLTYRSEVTISSAAEYRIRARQTDLAGNVSDPTATVTITINRQEALLQSLGGSNPGTYTVGQIVDVRINLADRGTLSVSNNTLSVRLNIRNGGSNYRDVSINTSSGIVGSSLVFRYTVQDGDEIAPFVLNGNTVNTLEVIDLLLNSAVISMGGNSINTELKSDWDRHGRQGLSFYTSINIRTDIPQLISAELTEDSRLVLTFSEDVYRGTGTITLLQAGTYLAPAVMSRNDYFRFGGNSLSPYYTIGTNGTDANGDPDLTEKYILNFNVEPDYSALTNILTGAGAARVQIPVASGAVSVSGSVMTVTVDENWGYHLRVKGVNYTLTLPNSIVRDEQNNYLAGFQAGTTTLTVANPGVNRPFIRVERNRGSFNTETVTFSGTTQTVPYWVNLTNAQTSLTATNPATMPASAGTWRQVVQYRATGTYTSQRDQPASNQDKFWQTPANNVTYWVNNQATMVTANPNNPTGYGRVAPHYMKSPYSVSTFDPAVGGANNSGYTQFNRSGTWVLIGAVRTANQGSGWVQGAGGTYSLQSSTNNSSTNLSDWYWVFGSRNENVPTSVRNALDPDDISVSHYIVPFVQIDYSVMPSTTNPGNNRYVQASVPFWVQLRTGVHDPNNQWDATLAISHTEIPEYWLQWGTGTWDSASRTGQQGWVPAIINEATYIDLRTVTWNTTTGTHQLPRYWVRTDNLDAANFTQTDMSGTPGWVRVDVSVNVGGSVIDTPVAVQPYTARVRIDTQTPGAVINYSDPGYAANRRERTAQTGTEEHRFNGNPLSDAGAHPIVLSYPHSTPSLGGEPGESVSFTLLQGNANRNGYIFGLSARASIGSVQSEIVYEKATRSVVAFNFGTVPPNWATQAYGATGTLKGRATAMGKALQLWLRGGDDTSGQNSIPGFPLSWNERDYTGIRLMTNTTGLSTDTGVWYWMSWEITDTAYFYFIAGTTGDVTNGYNVNQGPLDWAWGKNAWAVQQHRYPLYPGGSLEFSTGTQVVNPATSSYQFYDTFSGSR